MKRLSVVIPAYNEERFIGTLLERIKAVDLAPLGYAMELIVVDDKSRDRTAEIVAAIPGVRLLRMEKNGGKGRAVRAGIAAATGDLLIIQDADLEYDPQDYVPMLRLLRSLRGVAKRRLPKYGDRKRYFDHLVSGKVFRLVRAGRPSQARRAALEALAAEAKQRNGS